MAYAHLNERTPTSHQHSVSEHAVIAIGGKDSSFEHENKGWDTECCLSGLAEGWRPNTYKHDYSLEGWAKDYIIL